MRKRRWLDQISVYPHLYYILDEQYLGPEFLKDDFRLDLEELFDKNLKPIYKILKSLEETVSNA